jgi:hypothetical protein
MVTEICRGKETLLSRDIYAEYEKIKVVEALS